MRSRLYVPHAQQVLDTIGVRFTEPVHHRDRGLHAHVMGNLHDLEPAVGAYFLPGHPIAHVLNQDLTAAAGNGIESRIHQPSDDFLRRHSEPGGEEIDL